MPHARFPESTFETFSYSTYLIFYCQRAVVPETFRFQIDPRRGHRISNHTEFIPGANGGELWTHQSTSSSAKFNGNLGQWMRNVASPMERRNYLRLMRLLSDFEASCGLYVSSTGHFTSCLTQYVLLTGSRYVRMRMLS